MAWKEKYLTKKGFKWRVRWMEGGKQQHKGAGVSKQTAGKIEEKIETILPLKDLSIPDDSKNIETLIEDFLKYCQDAQKAENTILQYKFSLNPFKAKFASYGPKQVTPQALERFKVELLSTPVKASNWKNPKVRSINGAKIILRTIWVFFQHLKRLGYVEQNPADDTDTLDEQQVWRFLNGKEEITLLNGCRFNQELEEIILIALRTGMRENEILLKLTQERIWEHCIHFEAGETKRNKRKRTIPITKDILFVESKVKSGRLYPGWNKNRLLQSFDRAVEREELGQLRFHDLKHTFCSNWLKNGGDIKQLQEITGNSLQSLQKYLHVDKDHLIQTAQRIFSKNYGGNYGGVDEFGGN